VGPARVGDDANTATLVRRLDNVFQRRIRREVPTQLDHQLRRLLQTWDVLVGDHRAEHVYGHQGAVDLEGSQRRDRAAAQLDSPARIRRQLLEDRVLSRDDVQEGLRLLPLIVRPDAIDEHVPLPIIPANRHLDAGDNMYAPPLPVLDRLDDRALVVVVADRRDADTVLVQTVDEITRVPDAIADEGVKVQIDRGIGRERRLDRGRSVVIRHEKRAPGAKTHNFRAGMRVAYRIPIIVTDMGGPREDVPRARHESG